MFIFGHVGITLGAATAVNAVVNKLQFAPKKLSKTAFFNPSLTTFFDPPGDY